MILLMTNKKFNPIIFLALFGVFLLVSNDKFNIMKIHNDTKFRFNHQFRLTQLGYENIVSKNRSKLFPVHFYCSIKIIKFSLCLLAM